MVPAARNAATAKGYTATAVNAEVCQTAGLDALVIAVKPGIVPAVCADIMAAGNGNNRDGQPLILSVAAGVTLATLQTHLPGRRVVRVMPNTPCTVAQSATGYCLGHQCSPADNTTVERIFGAVGGPPWAVPDETLLNGVTGLSGSGPAYVFLFIEALADGGVRVGLPRAAALQLAAQTVQGSAAMVLQGMDDNTNTHPAELKDRVCSPGGTTIAGVEALEEGGLRATVMRAVQAATRRSLQLGGALDADIGQKYNLYPPVYGMSGMTMMMGGGTMTAGGGGAIPLQMRSMSTTTDVSSPPPAPKKPKSADALLQEESIQAFVESLAAKQPTPGGGAAAAMGAAIGAAAASMSANYTQRKKDVESGAAGQAQELLQFMNLSILMDYADADAKAYQELQKTWKKDHGLSEEEIKEIQLTALKVPSQLLGACYYHIKAIEGFLPHCNPNITSDAKVGIHLLAGAARAAYQTFLVNTPPAEDKQVAIKKLLEIQESESKLLWLEAKEGG